MLKEDWQHLRCEQKGSRTKKFVKIAAAGQFDRLAAAVCLAQ